MNNKAKTKWIILLLLPFSALFNSCGPSVQLTIPHGLLSFRQGRNLEIKKRLDRNPASLLIQYPMKNLSKGRVFPMTEG